LLALEEIAKRHPILLTPYYKRFYLFTLEKLFCRLKKLAILYLLSDSSNYNDIFKEYIYHTNSTQPDIAAHALHYLGKFALKYKKKISGKCMKHLVSAMTGKNTYLSSKAVMALADYIKEANDEKLSVLAFCLSNFSKIEMPVAKFKLLSLLIDFMDKLPTLSYKCFRTAVQNFTKETTEIKLKVLELGFNLLHLITESDKDYAEFISVYNYLIELGSFDSNPSIREFTRFIKSNTQKDNLTNPSIFKSFSETILHTTLNAQTIEEPTYGLMSDLVQRALPDTKPLPTANEREKESTTKLREPVLEEEKITLPIVNTDSKLSPGVSEAKTINHVEQNSNDVVQSELPNINMGEIMDSNALDDFLNN